MSTLAIFGGTGFAGGHIAREAAARGHRVISYSRSEPTQRLEGVEYRTGSVVDADTVTRAAQDADQVVVATHAADLEGGPLAAVLPQLVQASIDNDARLSFVGGAGSSLVAEGGPRLLDTPEFNDEWKPEALAHSEVLDGLRQSPEQLDWFYVSPAGLFGAWAGVAPTGEYRTGGDVLVTKPDGSSEISGEDLALAYVDEIDQHQHPRQRFTVGH